MKHGKKYRANEGKIDRTKVYPLDNAIQLAKDTSYMKFNGIIELLIKVNYKFL